MRHEHHLDIEENEKRQIHYVDAEPAVVTSFPLPFGSHEARHVDGGHESGDQKEAGQARQGFAVEGAALPEVPQQEYRRRYHGIDLGEERESQEHAAQDARPPAASFSQPEKGQE